MPRSRSSARRSGSMPVSARTSAVLPWSMCPAVPTIMLIMRLPILIIAAALAPAAQPPAPTFRTGTSLVRVDVQVLDKGQPVTGLQARDFVLKEEGVAQRIESLGVETEPLQ